MGPTRWRMGIRPQLTIIVLMAAVLSTVATLFVTESAVKSYVETQARDQEAQHMRIAKLVLSTNFGENISISSDKYMVVDSPGASGGFRPSDSTGQYPFGKYKLNGDTDYVDLVQQLVGGMVSIYQCADEAGNAIDPCTRIASTFRVRGAASATNAPRDITNVPLEAQAVQNMRLVSAPVGSDGKARRWTAAPQEWVDTSPVTINGIPYIADYAPILNPQNQLIGVLFIGVPYDAVTSVVANTTIELVIIGTVIMVLGVLLAIFVASAIVGTLQRAARQVSSASERFGAIASQQSSGSTQQVWAINAINQALQSLAETATDISRRTDQLAQMGNQILQRRSEISPTQIDSIVAYITRSVRDISVASRHQSATYERMTGAMQAVMEVAEQVAGDSQQTSDGADRLEQVVQQLRQLVGVSRRGRQPGTTTATSLEFGGAQMAAAAANGQGRTVQAVPPQRGPRSRRLAGARPELARGSLAGVGAGMPSTGQNMRLRRGMQQSGDMGMGGPTPRGPMPAPYPSGPQLRSGGGWGQMPSGPFGGTPSFGEPGANTGWTAPSPNSGPAPWAGRGPNSGPNSGPTMGGPNSGPNFGGPNSGGFPPPAVGAPGGDRRRFGQNSGPNFGTPERMPSLDGAAGANAWGDGNTNSQPWTRNNE
jgi:hypothetical protein